MARAARGELAEAGDAASRPDESGVASVGARARAAADEEDSLLEVRDLVKHFRSGKRVVHAVNGVSFTIGTGRTLALVGESGSGKTTIGRCIAGLIHPTQGEIRLVGQELGHISTRKRSKESALETHVVFQEPRESLNPRWPLGKSIEEPLLYQGKLNRRDRARRVLELLELVGLRSEYADVYPHQTTAGVQQRVATARAIAVHPRLVILDEPTSALDMSVKAQMIELLIKLQEELGLSYLFISHDMTAVKMIAHEIAIMYLGRIVERGPAAEVFEEQLNPYGRALLSSVLYPDPTHERGTFRLEGEIPSPIDLPAGCHLASRCPLVEARCRTASPPLERVGALERWSACFRTEQIVAAGGPEALRGAERGAREETPAA
jgi:oligopeptide/dipeptide ABC transporter ATP-binding protein